MLEIYDCTLREGMQAEGLSFSVSDKLAVIKALDSLGVSYIEAGTPGSNPKDEELFRALADVSTDAELVAFGATRRKELKAEEDENLAALAGAGTKVVTLYGKAWDRQVTEVLRTGLDENLAMVRDSVAFMKSAGKRVFFDAEHFFDGFAGDAEYALAVIEAAHEAGATFIVSPDSDPDVIAETKRLGMASIPGAMTPTEIKRAYALGADIVKLFPADDLGYHYIQNLKGPLPHIPLMATGGVNPQTIPEFLSRGILAVGTGITIFRPDLVAAEDYAGIKLLAKAHVDAIRSMK